MSSAVKTVAAAPAAKASAPKKTGEKKPGKAMKPMRARKAPAVEPESHKKKMKTLTELAAKRTAAKAIIAKKGKATRKAIFKRAEKYTREYHAKERSELRARRQAKNAGNFYIAPEAKVLFVVRIRGIMNVAPKTKKILQLLRLRQINNGIFLKVNKATLIMLRIVEPYVTYGVPNLKTIRELIYKRGYGKVNHQRIALTDNAIVAKVLGKFNIICVEDLIHEIVNCGEHFKEANNFLWPFKLSSPLGGFIQKKIHFAEGGDHGNREEYINNLMRQMC